MLDVFFSICMGVTGVGFGVAMLAIVYSTTRHGKKRRGAQVIAHVVMCALLGALGLVFALAGAYFLYVAWLMAGAL